MEKSITVNRKSGEDRLPAAICYAVRLPVELTAAVDKWARVEANRSEAIRRLVELGLKAKK